MNKKRVKKQAQLKDRRDHERMAMIHKNSKLSPKGWVKQISRSTVVPEAHTPNKPSFERGVSNGSPLYTTATPSSTEAMGERGVSNGSPLYTAATPSSSESNEMFDLPPVNKGWVPRGAAIERSNSNLQIEIQTQKRVSVEDTTGDDNEGTLM
jgi:hypothetical protein